ncbi:MAG TPA: hypothetical protein VMV79_00265 [Alphaproteobacteria bacterium]|nr:hypothetical protein [Alphaproteobacteria bacterium]
MSPSDISGADPGVATPGVADAAAPDPAAPIAALPSWQDQDAVLRDLWMQNKPPAAIAEELGRSVAAIMTRAARLGLPRRFAPGRKPGHQQPPAENAVRAATRAARHAEAAEVSAQTSARICLMCLGTFQSLGRHNRICPTCKGSSEYESASRLPDFDFTSAET